MSNEFQPYDNEGKSHEFSVWQYHVAPADSVPEVTKEEHLAQELEQLKQDAIQRGYAEGMKQAQDEILLKQAELAHWLELIQKPVQLLDNQLVQEITQTILWLSAQCIGVELSVNPDKLRTLLETIKDELPSLRGNKLFIMNPEDAQWVRDQIHEKDIPGLLDVIATDPLLNRGDFYLKSEHSDLDGRLQSRLLTLFAKYINKDNLMSSQDSQ